MLNCSFLQHCDKKFDEDKDRNKIFTCKKDKDQFDNLEKLSITDLWQKFYPNIPIDLSLQLYLRDRGLLEEIGSERIGTDVYPIFGWKDITKIDWLTKHVPQNSILVDENYFKERLTVNIPFRYSQD